MSNAQKLRNDLLASLQQVSQDFSHAGRDIDHREQKLQQSFGELGKQLQQAEKTALRSLENGTSSSLHEPLKAFVEEVAKANQHWQSSLAKHDRQTKFRKGFDDSLLVFVYGKVKAGKSSLGNYIAWGTSEPTESSGRNYPGTIPRFQTHDSSQVAGGDSHKEAENSARFKVGQMETTSSIQSFALPGFTWVDSPGLHSTNAQNGELAKAYVQAADLIVYAMESQNPGRASDLAEITELLQKEKNLIVLLTRSDTLDEDEDEEGNIVSVLKMKSDKDRADQVAYVQGEIAKLNNREKILGKALPISVKYAEMHGNDPIRFEDSGLAEFLRELQSVSQGASVHLKQETPLANLRDFGNDLKQSTQVLTYKLDELGKSLQRMKQETEDARLSAIAEVRRNMETEVRTALEEHRGDSSRLQAFLNHQFKEHATKAIHERMSGLLHKMEGSMQEFLSVEGIGNLPGFEERFHEAKKPKGLVGSAAGGAAGTAIGAAIGSFLGPVGTFVGGVVGGFVGNKIGEYADESDETIRFSLGDNSEEIAHAAYEAYAKASVVTVDKAFRQLAGPFSESMENLITQCKKALATFEQSTQEVFA